MPPAWPSPVVWYAFLGGVAAGACAVSALAELFGTEADRRAARGWAYLTVPLAAACLIFQAFGLAGRGRHAGPGAEAAALVVLGVSGLGSLRQALGEDGWLGEGPATARGRSEASAAEALVRGVAAVALGWLVAPGPVSWAAPSWLGAVSLATAAATGAAAMGLVAGVRNAEPVGDALERLGAMQAVFLVAELAVLTGLAVSVRGPSGLAFCRWPGMLLPLFVVPVGLVAPLAVRQNTGDRGAVDAALLVLLGGFVLRAVLAGVAGSLALR